MPWKAREAQRCSPRRHGPLVLWEESRQLEGRQPSKEGRGQVHSLRPRQGELREQLLGSLGVPAGRDPGAHLLTSCGK